MSLTISGKLFVNLLLTVSMSHSIEYVQDTTEALSDRESFTVNEPYFKVGVLTVCAIYESLHGFPDSVFITCFILI